MNSGPPKTIDENDASNIITELESEFVELYKILKFEGLTDSGGMAKQVIADGQVSVNGEVETKKRKKIAAGDKIEYSGQSIQIINKADSTEN
jgi:ribosome-associated protein